MKKMKLILLAIPVFFGVAFAPPTLAAADSPPTGFYAEAEVALSNFDCPAGLTCPGAEDTAPQVYPGGMPGGILVAQSDGYDYEGSKLDGYFLDTLGALSSLALVEHYYHLVEFHDEEVEDAQDLIEAWREEYRSCERFVRSALADLQAHQRKNNLSVSREHPTVSCPTEEPRQ